MNIPPDRVVSTGRRAPRTPCAATGCPYLSRTTNCPLHSGIVTTPKGKPPMTDHKHATATTPTGPCPDCAPSETVEFSMKAPGVWVLESAARTPPKPRTGPCPRCATNPATG